LFIGFIVREPARGFGTVFRRDSGFEDCWNSG